MILAILGVLAMGIFGLIVIGICKDSKAMEEHYARLARK